MADEPLTLESQRILDEIFKKYGYKSPSTTQTVMQGAGAMAGAAANSMAANRSVGLQAAYDAEMINQRRQELARQGQTAEADINDRRQGTFFDQMARREQDKRDSGRDAYLNSVRASYMKDPGIPKDSPYKPTRSAEQLTAADLLQAEAMKRLHAQDSLLPGVASPERFQFAPDSARFQFDPDLLKQSSAEKALNWGSAAAGIAGAVPSSGWKKVGKTAGKVGMKILDFIF